MQYNYFHLSVSWWIHPIIWWQRRLLWNTSYLSIFHFPIFGEFKMAVSVILHKKWVGINWGRCRLWLSGVPTYFSQMFFTVGKSPYDKEGLPYYYFLLKPNVSQLLWKTPFLLNATKYASLIVSWKQQQWQRWVSWMPVRIEVSHRELYSTKSYSKETH